MKLEERVIHNIRKYRKLRRISQEKLAELCNTSTSYIGLLEIGRNIPKLDTIERIAKALGIEAELLFIDSELVSGKEDKIATKNLLLQEIAKILDENL